MHSVQTALWDPRPPSKHASPLPAPHPTSLRLARVTTATPAKRITFYKSGDSQFGGVRMAIHKRSFKCFDALLDDLSQKVPLPFGVRTVTTPRGTNTIKHLEQLQDGGCYLCSDRRQAKPINMELACKRPSIWYHHGRRPQRPETSSATPPGHLPYRQRRILLVKNSEPGMRRSVVLSRRSTRSMRAFLDEVSEVMQFHVRKLYTAEGRRIDSIQTLMTCPGVLVCVGREAFSPLLINYIKKSSEEKLPGLGSRSPGLGPRTPGNGARSPATQGARSPPHGAQSRASEYSEGHESKKNVNFGLETKKSIIHPRSDSSNRSARFSLSSEKSYGNGVSAYSQARPAIMNDDIEKRVLVNKDGSLSVEMRVRFRLHNDETLQWSTQIKKSPSLTNDCCPLSQVQSDYLQQGQSESCSDPDSMSFDPEGVDYSNQPLQRALEANRCPCCYQKQAQQYDLWENPAHSHKQPLVPPLHPHTSSHTHTMMRHTHSSSSSSSCNSRRVVRCRAQLSSCGAGSGSEQSQLVQEEMCVTEQVERRVEVAQDGDTHVEVCRVSRCCSRSEVVAVDSNLRPHSSKSVEDELMMEDEGVRPLSAVSSSSHVLQSLKEDQDDDDDDEDYDLPPSASQCCHSNEPSPCPTSQTQDKPVSNEGRGSRALSVASSCHCGAEETDRAPSSKSRMSRTSCRSSKAKIPNSEEEGAADDEDDEIKRGVSGLSGHTGLSAGSQKSGVSSVCPNCGGCKHGVNSDSNSTASQRSHRSLQVSPSPASPLYKQENATNGSNDDDSDDSAMSTQSNKTNLTNHGRLSAISNVLDGRASGAMSRTPTPTEPAVKEEERAPSAASATSHRSNKSHKSGCNGATDVTGDNEEERSPSATGAQSNVSAKSRKSHKSNCSGTAEAPDMTTREEAEGENAVERATSSMSAKSGVSAKTSASVKSNKSNCPGSTQVASPVDNTAVEDDDTNKKSPSSLSVKSNASATSGKAERPDSALSAKSAKSNVTAKSSTSHRSTCSRCAKVVCPDAKVADEPIKASGQEDGTEGEERAASAMSAKSNLSVKSNKSHKSTKALERSLSPRSQAEGDGEERAVSQMSARSVKSNTSVKSSKSCKSNCNRNETVASPGLQVAEEAEEKENETVEEETQKRSESAMSAKSEKEERAASARSSRSHKSNCNGNTGASPERQDNTEDGEKAEERAASALSVKSDCSVKSNHIKTDADSMVDRTPSAMSGKSHKSQKSERNAASPNREEKQDEGQERVASAMSVKSKSSVRSSTSHKSNSSKNLKSVSPSPNVVTINTPEENETAERAPSTASAKSVKSNVSSNHNGTADEKAVEDRTPRSKSSEHLLGQTLSPKRIRSPRTHAPKVPAVSPNSPQSSVQKLLPGPNAEETRGPSALSVHSTTSAKSGRSKCHCGAASALAKAKKEKEEENKEVEKREDNEELKSEEASEQAASILSSSSKRQRRESGGTEQPLSRHSSGSVSLGLPEDQETADSDSGKSSISFHTNTESKGRVKTATPDVPKSAEESAVKEDVEEAGSTVSQKSKNNSNKSTSSHNLPAVDIPTIETPGEGEDKDKDEEDGVQKTERAASEVSAKSNRSHKSSCNCSVKAAAHKPKERRVSASSAGNDLETESVKSASTSKAKNLDTPDKRTSSAMSSASAKVRNKSPASASAAKTPVGDLSSNDTENQNISRPVSEAKGKEDIADDETASVHSKSPCCLRPESAASAQSGAKMKATKQSKGDDSVKSDHLNPVKGPKARSTAGSDSGSVKTSSSQKKETLIKSSSPGPSHSSRPSSKVETCSESTLSHSLSAADLLKETMAARPHSQQSKASKTSGKTRSEKSAKCQKIKNQNDQEEELTPACLPNASPNEVVSNWLQSIPVDSSMLTVGDELHEGEQDEEVEENPGEEVAKEGESTENEKVEKEEKSEAEEGVEKEGEAKCDAVEEEKSPDPAPGDAVGTSSRNNPLLLSSESLPRNWHSSAAVMKVLLSSSLGRCRSMPEVSPVYGRRLSTSARGLLDCLAQLQLIEPAGSPGYDQQKDRKQQYEDIMAILQSLWLTEPRDIEAMRVKDTGGEQVTPPRSSSGVDMSSGSGGSGKENGNQGGDETPPKETESLHEDDGAEKGVEKDEERNAEAGHKDTEAEPEETSTQQATPNIADEQEQSEEQSTVPPSLDSPKATDNPSSSEKSSANDSSKSPTDNEHETVEDSSSGTPPTVLRAPLSKRLSQDPDPVWVMHLLKKLEKQFMNHYINAMAEFKVRWDLDDSLILDTMISELRDEVSRRIQSSIEREMRKIQSRAGRGGRSPRPPQGGNLSRESTMTEKRRRMLKVMKNQSVKTADSLSDGEMTGEFSDQRSDDEYCPCDACVRKKMAARPLKTNPMAAEAPVMMEFDLLKILQLKKSPSPAPVAVPQSTDKEVDRVVIDEEGRNLEVVREEEEEDETKEDIKAEIVLEETIPEEDEEMEQEEDGGEAGEEEEVGDENSLDDEEHEEGQTGGEETGEEEAPVNGEEEEEGEEEGEGECQCQSARNEEESDEAEEGEEAEETGDNKGEDETTDDEERRKVEGGENAEDEEETGEDETGDNEGETGTGEEESDKETVTEATAGKGEATDNGEDEEETEEKECEVCDFKPEEEETSEGESGGEEETDGDNVVKNEAKEKSTPAEEFVEGNVSTSAEAEDEDDGEDGTGEGESHEDGKGGESEKGEEESSEEERASKQDQGVAPPVCVTEGEEADAEDSDTDNKRPSDTSADESGREGAGTTGDEEEKEGGRDGDEEEVEEDAVEEFKPEEEVNGSMRKDGALLHQFTRTSVESQPGSLENIDMDSLLNPVSSVEVPKMAAGISTTGGTSQRRSRSPARVKRRKPKESDVELDNL
ncbi:retinitis pigmentosa 1-like 1 protein [Toxotes jaculatrix]|uniref:retinitis pigmentosa 1-like 1 protein n=1 Tax=Toxotes jaculatrix TaxID=941984 RepID=UPI001B3B0352|nr:retinitis pigmentosa 1-like 1 protein [Toxotes jaculatrix]